MEKDEQIPGAPIEDPVMALAVVAAEFPELAFNLRRVGKRQWRTALAAQVEAVDLVLDHHSGRERLQTAHEVTHWLRAVARPVVNRPH